MRCRPRGDSAKLPSPPQQPPYHKDHTQNADSERRHIENIELLREFATNVKMRVKRPNSAGSGSRWNRTEPPPGHIPSWTDLPRERITPA